MKMWEDPEKPGAARWRCVRPEVAWEVLSGSWYRSVAERVFLVVTVRPSVACPDTGHPFYAWARRLALAEVTAEQVAMLGLEAEVSDLDLLDACVERGWGVVLGGVGAPSPKTARTLAKKLAEESGLEPIDHDPRKVLRFRRSAA